MTPRVISDVHLSTYLSLFISRSWVASVVSFPALYLTVRATWSKQIITCIHNNDHFCLPPCTLVVHLLLFHYRLLKLSITEAIQKVATWTLSLLGNDVCSYRSVQPSDAHCCHMGTAIEHPVPERHLYFLTSGHSDAHGWASECPDVKNYKWRLNPVWHRMLYSCTHMATVGVGGLIYLSW